MIIILLLAAMASVQSVSAATITVTNTNDSGAGSLRQALADANDGDTIDFAITGAITLTSDQLVVDRSITISGPGASQLAVQRSTAGGTPAFRIFQITAGHTVIIQGLTIGNGLVQDVYPANTGGGIHNDHSTLAVSNCTLSGNAASGNGGSGGGIYNSGSFGSATLTIANSTLNGNSATSNGGGILSSGNSGSATITITNSTLNGNSASQGGGIFNGVAFGSATLTIVNSTLSGNAANYGGGIYNFGVSPGGASVTISSSTFTGNSAEVVGGGIFNQCPPDGSATLEIGDTILNAGASGVNIRNDAGTVISDGYNLSSDGGSINSNGGTGDLNASGDQLNTDPMLGPLQDNGGPTFTHELLTGSPGIDAGDPDFSPPPDYDQRGSGYLRVVNNRIDIGSFEVQSSVPCPQRQGYWKNNPDAWPVNSLTLGSQTYTKTELLSILKTRIGSGPKADASLILADQLIAARLNIENGSDPAPVSGTITHADSLLSGFNGKLPYNVKPSSATGQAMVNDANMLNDYNNGNLTPGCTL